MSPKPLGGDLEDVHGLLNRLRQVLSGLVRVRGLWQGRGMSTTSNP
jgi:hypothetical protein